MAEGPGQAADVAPTPDSVAGGSRPDTAATAAELARLRPLMLTILRRRYGWRVSAEDVYSQALVITLSRLEAGTLEDPDRAGGFLCGAAHRIALAELRRDRARGTDTGLEELIAEHPDPGGGAEDATHRSTCAALVRRLLLELPVARDREVLSRFYLDGEDRESICREFGLDDAHFNRVTHRARKRLGALLAERGFGGLDLLCGALLVGLLGTTLYAGAGFPGSS